MLTAGTRLGPYEIVSAIGAGGMGEVYQAHDTKLGRDVAIKVLPEVFAHDPERLSRFQREAKMLASLNHPNIAAIYGLEEDAGRNYLVMELVPGETLAQRVKREGPVPIEGALAIAKQIADALDAAHEKEIVHRDLKPANVKVTPEGRVKVLDFGLAKTTAFDNDVSFSQATTLSEVGRIVGTPAYMSPEQARGKVVDKRTDIWAFGCVFYELLVGKPAFRGETFSDTLAKVLEREPDWSALPAKTPAKIRQLLLQCLRKDADLRLLDVAEARRAIEEVITPVRRVKHWQWIAAAAIALALFAVANVWMRRPAPATDRSEWVQLTNFSDSVSQPALSPDGRMLTFVRGPGTFYTPGQIYIKLLPDGEPKQLTNDDLRKMSPVFSPEGSRIAYTTVDEQFKWDTWLVPTLGGEARRWLPNTSGLVWRGKHAILFSEIKTEQHMGVVSAEESRFSARDVYVPAHENGMAHRSYPSPDGKWLLLAEMDGAWLPCRLVPLDGGSAGRQVGPPNGACTFSAWSPDGKWMYFSSSASGAFHIWRQRFPDGTPKQITSGPTEEEGIAMAPDGRSFITAVGQRQRPLTLHKPGGDRQISLEGYAYEPKFTPDGKSLVYRILKGSSPYTDATELWVVEADSGHAEQLLPGFSMFGSGTYDISADGNQVVVAARDRDGKDRLWLAPLDRRSPPHQMPGVQGDWALFGEPGEIYFRATDGFAYRVKEDGTGLEKAIAEPVNRIDSISPDKQWLVALSAHTWIYPLKGGAPIHVQGDIPSFKWSPNGKLLYVSWANLGMTMRAAGKTYVIPLSRGQMLPQVPEGGFRSEQDFAKLPGVRVIDAADVAPGPTPDVYAFSRETTQRNLFRIPIP